MKDLYTKKKWRYRKFQENEVSELGEELVKGFLSEYTTDTYE